MNLDKLYQLIRWLAWVGFAVLLLFLFSQKVVLRDNLVYATDFIGNSRFIEGPYPDGRVEQLQTSVSIIKIINYEPVYFNVYAPRRFAKVRVTMDYQLASDLPARIGLKKTGVYDFDFMELPATGTEFKQGVFEFNTRNADRVKNKFQLILSSPGLNEKNDKIFIKNIGFEFIPTAVEDSR